MPDTLAGADRERLVATSPGWTLADDGKSVSTELEFANFADAWGFTTLVHLPLQGPNVYNRVAITLTTHDAGGLTERDQALADRIAATVERRGKSS